MGWKLKVSFMACSLLLFSFFLWARNVYFVRTEVLVLLHPLIATKTLDTFSIPTDEIEKYSSNRCFKTLLELSSYENTLSLICEKITESTARFKILKSIPADVLKTVASDIQHFSELASKQGVVIFTWPPSLVFSYTSLPSLVVNPKLKSRLLKEELSSPIPTHALLKILKIPRVIGAEDITYKVLNLIWAHYKLPSATLKKLLETFAKIEENF